MTAEAAPTRAARDKAEGLPARPGIYFFKNARGQVVYVGKARSLRDRVRSYFQASEDPKVRHIIAETADVDYILTGSEREAAFLENNYVQQLQPKFNLRLRDDKSFPYLKVTVQEKYPGVYLSRRVAKDGARYFGPFSPARELRRTIQLVTKLFRVRSCTNTVFKGRKRPCLEYDLGLSSAPCVGLIGEEAYRESVQNALLLLEGRTDELAAIAGRKMDEAARAQAFEEAAHWRDVLRVLEHLRLRPGMISVGRENQDIVGFARTGPYRAGHVFLMRKGKVVGSREVFREGGAEASDAEALRDLLAAAYAEAAPPPRILLPFAPRDPAELAGALSAAAGRRIAVVSSTRGKNRRLVDLAVRNAERLLDKREEIQAPLAAARDLFGLPDLPVRIEGFDVSNTGGDESVASLVSFLNGRPDKDEYRKFRIKTVAGPNDVASLAEVIRRRYSRRLAERSPLPDLVFVDGGKPQLGAALEALRALGLERLPVVSLAKREEILFSAAHREGLRLEPTSAALKLFQRVRDEAHRFAVQFHRRRREKKSFA